MLVVDRISNKSETQTAPYCFSFCFPQGGERTPETATSKKVDESLPGLGQNCFLTLRPDNSSKQAPLDINRAGDDGVMEMRNAVPGSEKPVIRVREQTVPDLQCFGL